MGTCSAQRIFRTYASIIRFVNLYETSGNTIHTKLCLIRNCPDSLTNRKIFAPQFLAWMEVNNVWPWKILRTNETHFYHQGSVITQNCRIWASENSLQMPPFKASLFFKGHCVVWVTPTFIVVSFFFEEISPSRPVSGTFNWPCYESILRNQFIPELQQRGCVNSMISTPMRQLLNLYFWSDRIVNPHFPTIEPLRSSGLKFCNFWMWSY